ncbi:Glucose/arabinose dehydrogenase, beta-propeller fold [Arenibacter nanhaiticus]|uniref:Glucose/arabinose dehydrogenase, beta-propeller fold n=1 Tax=Arenibacter nanhaiticus TaxID=558155 RepID=A0A1M6J5T6_9FLAO|nr:PQQ-dependent sugar dehydrogenase [Arenibacter nanhaiticus]SHJ42017.1 Glucose/arabinose dehydrogenase, beta-propeller fold [Arenibacter nanhaiticus]
MKYSILLLGFTLLTMNFSCAQSTENKIDTPKKESFSTELIIDELQIPWGMAFLPDGSMLITEKSGELIHFKDGKKSIVSNVPDIYVRGQGGLLDIALHPDYKNNGWIYISYASEEGAEKGGNTTLLRAKLQNNSLTNSEVLYKATPNTTKGQHFGSRIVFDNDGYLYFSIGDRGDRDVNPQDISRDGGKIYRLHDDGAIPNDNPFVSQEGAKKAIFSYGHRNPQGLIKNPVTGTIWEHEHGPQGGDEINIIEKGKNYGWPLVTYGINYSGTSITDNTELEGTEQPIYYWVPSIAPSGMAFVTSDKYPDWKNNLLIGSLKFQYLERLVLKDNKVVKREKLMTDIGRVRDVRQAPDGYIYVAVEGKGIFKLIPN